MACGLCQALEGRAPTGCRATGDDATGPAGLPLTAALRAQVAHEPMRMVPLHTRIATVAASGFAVLLAPHLQAA